MPDKPDIEYTMVDVSIVKVRRHGQRAKYGLRTTPLAARKAV